MLMNLTNRFKVLIALTPFAMLAYTAWDAIQGLIGW